MSTDLPDMLFVQPGKIGNDDLFVNRTTNGVMSRKLGPDFQPGARVGIYKLERITTLGVAVVEVMPTPAAATPPAAVPPAPPKSP